LYPALDPTRRFPQILTEAGVDTHAVVGLFFLGEPFGVVRGFAHEEVVVRAREHASAAQVVTPLVRRLRAVKSRQRAFLYAHMMEPHEPYNRGKLKEGRAYDRYLSEVQEVDRWIRRVWRHVRRRFPRRGYLVVTSDHGEAFGEHGTHFHTKTLYEELLRVPLVVWGPGVVPGTREDRVSLVDVGPTLLDLFGVAVPSAMMGTSLLPHLRGAPLARHRPIMAEGRLRRVLYASGDLKVIEDGVRKTVEVYDLRRDPGETNNLFDLDRARVAAAVAELRQRHDAIRVRGGDYEPPYKP
jgi:arylsulfatase A-like enzyme